MKMSIGSNHVTIGVPVYNGGKFIEECLNSIKQQTYENWECHIINNRSTDDTQQIAQQFVDADPRFKLFNYEDFLPIEKNWNRTTEHISKNTVYFKLVQADDWIDKDYLREMITLLDENPNVGMCTSYRINGKVVDCDGLNIEEGNVLNGKELLEKHLLEKIELTGSITTPLFRMETLKQVQGFPKIFDEEDYHIDTQLAYHLMNLADVGFIFKILSYTRWHEDAETSVLCVKHNTFLDGCEKRLYKFRHVSKAVEEKYIRHRHNYAYFLLKQKIFNKKETLNWHKRYLLRPFTFNDYLKAFLLNNGISYRLRKVFGNRNIESN